MIISNTPDPINRAFEKLERLIPSSHLFSDTFSKNPFVKQPLIGSLFLQAKDLSADTSSIMRQGSSPALSALGMTTAFNTFQGIFSLEKARHNYHKANALEDTNGKRIALSDIAMRIGQVFGGLSFLIVRLSDIGYRGFQTLKSWQTPAGYALAIGTHSFAVLYIGLIILSTICLTESQGFLNRLKKIQTQEDIRTLIGNLTGKELWKKNIGKEIGKKDVYSHLGMELRSILCEIDPEITKPLSDAKLGKALFKDEYKKFLPFVLSRMNIKAKDGITLEDLKINPDMVRTVLIRRQQSVYERVLGGKGIGLVENAKNMNLYDLLLDPKTRAFAEEIAKDLLASLEKCAEEQKPVMIAYWISGVLGTIFTIASDFVMGPVDAFICNIGFLICFLSMTYGDGKTFLDTLHQKDTPVGKYAKPYIWSHLLLGAGAIATASALGAVTGGAFPLACLVVIGSVWIGVDVWMLQLLEQRIKEYNKSHPKLENLLSSLELSRMDFLSKEVFEIFSKLPKLQRDAILEKLLENSKGADAYYLETLKTLKLSKSQKSIAAKGEILLQEGGAESEVFAKALDEANRKILGGSKHRFTRENIKNHPCKELFYRTFYNEFVRFEQRKLFSHLGSEKLKSAVKKVIALQEDHKDPVKLKKISKEPAAGLPSFRWAALQAG